jgi:hypothetical protein
MPFGADHNLEALIKQSSMKPLNETVGLRPADLGSAMFDAFQP